MIRDTVGYISEVLFGTTIKPFSTSRDFLLNISEPQIVISWKSNSMIPKKSFILLEVSSFLHK